MIFAPFAYKQARRVSAATTATIQIVNYDGTTVTWYKNGVSQGSVPTSLTTTFPAGTTFYVTNNDAFGASIYYYLNGAFITQYFGSPTATTATFTAVAGNTYRFECTAGA